MELSDGDELQIGGQPHIILDRDTYNKLRTNQKIVEALGLEESTSIPLALLVRLHIAIRSWNYQQAISETKIADKTLRAIVSGDQSAPYKSTLKKLCVAFGNPFLRGLALLKISPD